MTDGGRGKRPAMDGGAWIAAKTVSRRLSPVACFVVVLAFAFPAFAVPCGSGSFESWLESFKREAAARGISQRTIASALSGVSFDPGIVSRDHAQGVFRQSFEQFAGRMVSADRLQKGASLLSRQAALFGGIEQRFGVPGPVLVAIWGSRPISASTRGGSRPSGRWRRSPTTAAAPSCSRANCWTRCASSSAAT